MTNSNPKDILKDQHLNSKELGMFEVVKWWETRRITYNLILMSLQIIMMFLFSTGTLKFGIVNTIMCSLFFTACANTFYTIGWIVEVWNIYYFKSTNLNSLTRKGLFILGILLSIFITIGFYVVTFTVGKGLFVN